MTTLLARLGFLLGRVGKKGTSRGDALARFSKFEAACFALPTAAGFKFLLSKTSEVNCIPDLRASRRIARAPDLTSGRTARTVLAETPPRP